jgi:hypothetical protein
VTHHLCRCQTPFTSTSESSQPIPFFSISVLFLVLLSCFERYLIPVTLSKRQRSVIRPKGTGSNHWSSPGALGYRPVVRSVGKEIPTTHCINCSLSFLTSRRIVYCRITNVSTDNSSETWTRVTQQL